MYIVSALYHFTLLENFEALKAPLLKLMQEKQILGTLLLAREGINGTISGTREAIDELISYLRSDHRLKNLKTKESLHTKKPFERCKVKLKKEIVTMGVEGIDPTKSAGTYIKPKDWNDFISQSNVLVIDTRNKYEGGIGAFQNAIQPNTDTFREFPQYVQEHLAEFKDKEDLKIAMYCTGGIRCEKSTAYLKEQGFKEVYHLEGGILKYLEEIPEHESLWEGECFVFDDRVSVKHGLAKGQYDQCYACRMPITDEDKLSSAYIKGISCPHCIDSKDNEQIKRYAERQKQITIAAQRGQKHIGNRMPEIIRKNKELKRAAQHQTRMPVAEQEHIKN